MNVLPAGGLSEGGYLGFAEIQYVHMPLPGGEPPEAMPSVALIVKKGGRGENDETPIGTAP